MGADFVAILGYKQEENAIVTFFEKIKKYEGFEMLKGFIHSLESEFPETDWGQKWYIDEQDNYIEIGGRGGFTFYFSERCCMVNHHIRWLTFILDDVGMNTQTNLRKIMNEVAKCLGVNLAIYIPDSAYSSSRVQDLFYDGKELNDILTWLEYNCGDPVNHISEMYNESLKRIVSTGYYIDSFTYNHIL